MVSAPKQYSDAVEHLARDHGESDASIREIWSFPDPEERVVRLVEVSDAELPPENGHVLAVRFGPWSEFPFASEVALLTREDWDRVRKGELRLPRGWEIGGTRKVWG